MQRVQGGVQAHVPQPDLEPEVVLVSHDWCKLAVSVWDLEHRFVAVAMIPAVGVDEAHDGFDRAQGGVSSGGQRDLVYPVPKLVILGFGDGDEKAVL